MKAVSTLIVFALILSACSATPELKRARQRISNRVVHYSEISGESYRYPPLPAPEPEMRAMMSDEALSNSPFSTEDTIVKMNPGRKQTAASKQRRQAGVVYSPFTGDTVQVR